MSQTKLENAIEVIGQGIFEIFQNRDVDGVPIDKGEKEASDNVNSFVTTALDSYVLVEWPESQEYMEEDWFEEEAILALGTEDKIGGAAYFIPIKRIIK